MHKPGSLRIRFSANSSAPRTGFTLLEVLVVISISAVLMALILPAIQNARMAARRLQCLNNLKNHAIGMTNYVQGSGGFFPSVFFQRSGRTAVWTTELLPHLDARSVYDRLESDPAPDFRVSVFVCPEDDANEAHARGLSYVVNVGYGLMTTTCNGPPLHKDTISYNDSKLRIQGGLETVRQSDNYDGYPFSCIFEAAKTGSVNDRHIGMDFDNDGTVTQAEDLVTTATGVFWSGPEAINKSFALRRLDQGDGASHTLMLSERNKFRDWAVRPWDPGIDDVLLWRLRFLAPLTSHGFGMSTASFLDSAGANVMPNEGSWTSRPATHQLEFDVINTTSRAGCPALLKPTQQVINSPSPWHAPPKSAHSGGVNAAFCDGAVVFLSETIDSSVYARLLTSVGAQNGQAVVSDNEY